MLWVVLRASLHAWEGAAYGPRTHSLCVYGVSQSSEANWRMCTVPPLILTTAPLNKLLVQVANVWGSHRCVSMKLSSSVNLHWRSTLTFGGIRRIFISIGLDDFRFWQYLTIKNQTHCRYIVYLSANEFIRSFKYNMHSFIFMYHIVIH